MNVNFGAGSLYYIGDIIFIFVTQWRWRYRVRPCLWEYWLAHMTFEDSANVNAAGSDMPGRNNKTTKAVRDPAELPVPAWSLAARWQVIAVLLALALHAAVFSGMGLREMAPCDRLLEIRLFVPGAGEGSKPLSQFAPGQPPAVAKGASTTQRRVRHTSPSAKTLLTPRTITEPRNETFVSDQTIAAEHSNTTSPAIVLANEGGADSLRHGAEARFLHGVTTDEFVEDNYVGEYSLGLGGRVWIEDDRAQSGHLILHAEKKGLVRTLYRFNRFIYVYGERDDSPDPIAGTVTFFSDGTLIHQFLWQHHATQAFYPLRKGYGER